jgi:hypothetical protein
MELVIVTQCRLQDLPPQENLKPSLVQYHSIIIVSLKGREMLELGEKGRGANTAVTVARLPTLENL